MCLGLILTVMALVFTVGIKTEWENKTKSVAQSHKTKKR